MFEFADAEVAACQLQGNVLTLRFAAARVQSGPRSEAQWMALQLLAGGVQQASAGGAAASVGRLHDGLLRWADDGSRQRHLPLPFHSERACMLELEFAQGERCLFSAQSLQLQVLPGRCAVDAYQC
ncbi:hypothetical protein [Comamonas sp. GB3 AK4-5]|uniref:hypothetical protein n=1 Tax=Comamonas sp. GB3 AK4-5 TaxID=3231487 RepID=UPI00351E72B9